MTDRRPERLWHYTCEHTLPRILSGETLLPAIMLPRDREKWESLPPDNQWIADQVGQLVWLTDLAPPVYAPAVGLDSGRYVCDRTAHCLDVFPDWNRVIWWPRMRREHRDLAFILENAPGAMPMHWYVSAKPVPYNRQVR